MSLQVPLAAVPSQTFSINLGGQACQIAVFQLGVGVGARLYFNLQLAGQPIVNTRICRNAQRILLDAQYRGFLGDFMFIDTQGDTDPAYTGLGSRYELLYLSASELP